MCDVTEGACVDFLLWCSIRNVKGPILTVLSVQLAGTGLGVFAASEGLNSVTALAASVTARGARCVLKSRRSTVSLCFSPRPVLAVK